MASEPLTPLPTVAKPNPSAAASAVSGVNPRLERKLMSLVASASADYQLLEPGDKVMVAISGGKDSYTLLTLLHKLKARAPFPFELIAVNLDQGHPGFPKHVLPEYCTAQGFAYRIIEEDTLSIVKDKVPEGNTYCSLCSRLRRGILYNVAEELGATKIALGHHRDDSIETLMLNLFYSGQTKAMPPRLRSDDGRNTVIRPLIYCAEVDIAEYARQQQYPIIPCNLCGSQENLKRQQIKQLLNTLELENPKLRGNLLAALRNVRVTHMLDKSLTTVEIAAANAAAQADAATPKTPAQTLARELASDFQELDTPETREPGNGGSALIPASKLRANRAANLSS